MFVADLKFEYEEYKAFEEYGEVLLRNRYKLIKVPVKFVKEDILEMLLEITPKHTYSK